MELLESIRPKYSKDIVGNRLNIANFKNLLKSPPKIVALIGPIGCGKTLICDLVFKELDMQVYDISTKESFSNLSDILNNRTIESYANGNAKKIFVIDNIEILMTSYKTVISAIKQIIPKILQRKASLVIVTKPSEEKVVSNLPKIEVIKLNYLTTKDSFAYLLNRLEDVDDDHLLNVVKKHRGNIRDIILNLNISDVESEQVFSEYGNFDVMTSFITTPRWTVLNCEDIMVSYLLYENYPDEIYYNRDVKATLEFCINMNKNFITASKFDNINASIANILRFGGILVAQQDLKATNKERKSIKYRGPRALFKSKQTHISLDIPVLDYLNIFG